MASVPHTPDRGTPAAPDRWMRRSKAISISAAVLMAAALLYYSVRGIDWKQVARLVAGAEAGGLALGTAMGTATLFLRSYRWRILLNAEGTVSVGTAFWATAGGYFGNNFLPARAGELVRTFMISSRSSLQVSYVLATALSERVADAVALVLISALVLLTLPEPPGWLATAARPFAMVGLLGVLLIAALPRLETLGKIVFEHVPWPHLRQRLLATMDQGLRGIRAFHDLRRLSTFVGLTAVIWSMDAAGSIIVGRALGLAISPSVAFLLLAGLGLASALPSTPGYVGIYQFVAVTVLTPFGFSRTDAIAYILVAQALTYIVMTLWGSIGLWRYRQSIRAVDPSVFKAESRS